MPHYGTRFRLCTRDTNLLPFRSSVSAGGEHIMWLVRRRRAAQTVVARLDRDPAGRFLLPITITAGSGRMLMSPSDPSSKRGR